MPSFETGRRRARNDSVRRSVSLIALVLTLSCATPPARVTGADTHLLRPDNPALNMRAPELFRAVHDEPGQIVIECTGVGRRSARIASTTSSSMASSAASGSSRCGRIHRQFSIPGEPGSPRRGAPRQSQTTIRPVQQTRNDRLCVPGQHPRRSGRQPERQPESRRPRAPFGIVVTGMEPSTGSRLRRGRAVGCAPGNRALFRRQRLSGGSSAAGYRPRPRSTDEVSWGHIWKLNLTASIENSNSAHFAVKLSFQM